MEHCAAHSALMEVKGELCSMAIGLPEHRDRLFAMAKVLDYEAGRQLQHFPLTTLRMEDRK